MSFKNLFMFVCFCLLLVSAALAEVPQMINYQGKITTPEGALIDTTIPMIFAIYTDSIGTDSLWSETQSSVVVEKGIFSILLGSVNPIPDSVFTGETRYLGVKAGDDPEMSPRKAMLSVGYAYKAEYADTTDYAQFAVSDGDWETDTSGFNIYRLNGKVGIGTVPTLYQLDILNSAGTSVMQLKSTSSNSYLVLDKNASSNYGYVRFSTGGTEKWTLGQSGNDNFQLRFIPTSKVVLYANQEGKVGIGTTNPQGALDVNSTTDALIVPRMTTAQRGALTAVNGMIIYNTTTNQFNFYENGAWVTK